MEFSAKLLDIRDETHDVKTFRLERPDDFTWISGQYAMVGVEGLDGGRPFTFSNSPTDDYIELTIKKMGAFTSALFELKPGVLFKFAGPNGEKLKFDDQIKEDVVFLAGGSGITPFISALRYAKIRHLKNRMILFFGNRTRADVIYADELKDYEVINILSEEKVDGYEQGYIGKEVVEKHIEKPSVFLWYICGPPPMTEAMKKMLEEMGVAEDRWRVEPWELPGKGK